jgi:hypothetical protein
LKLGEYVFANRMGIALSVNSQSAKEKAAIRLYPNPSSGEVTLRLINLEVSGGEIVEIKNIEGKTVKQFTLASEEQNLNCTGLAAGTYVVTVNKDKKVIAKEKLIIQ